MRIAISLTVGWTIGAMLLGIYFLTHGIPLWLAPAGATGATFAAMWAFK